MLASCIRFCADGTLRGPDNYVVARCVEGSWQVSGRMHRELDCEGPVRLRLSMGVRESPRHLGPFRNLHTAGGVLYGDDTCLDILMPGRFTQSAGACHELTLFSEGGTNGKA
jgi:hypothetical protein